MKCLLVAWETLVNRIAYPQGAKRLLRPLGRLVIVEPVQSFGAPEWKSGAARLTAVLEQLGMRLAEVREYALDASSGLLAFVIDNSSTPPADVIDPNDCDW